VEAGLMLAVATTAGIVGRIAWGAAADRSGRLRPCWAGRHRDGRGGRHDGDLFDDWPRAR